MDDQFLFEMPAVEPAARAEEPRQGGQPRLRCAVRDQIEFRACALNDMLPDDHQARIVWKFVEGLDLSPIYDQIASVAGRPGHPATRPPGRRPADSVYALVVCHLARRRQRP